MSELEEYGIDLVTLQQMLDEWRNGAKKSALERRYLNRPEAHGKLFTGLVRRHLGVETERRSGQTERIAQLETEVARLRSMLLACGIDPDVGPAPGTGADPAPAPPADSGAAPSSGTTDGPEIDRA